MLGMGDRKSCLPVQITYTRMHCKRGYCLHIRRKNPLILGCENFVPALAGLFCVALPRPWKSTTFCITICYASLATSLIEVKGSAKRWSCYANQEPLYGAGNSANLKPSIRMRGVDWSRNMKRTEGFEGSFARVRAGQDLVRRKDTSSNLFSLTHRYTKIFQMRPCTQDQSHPGRSLPLLHWCLHEFPTGCSTLVNSTITYE